MCGVVGALGDHASKLDEAVGLLAHRGIRSTIKTVPSGGIGHVRLPIVGLDTEYDQPILDEGGRLFGFVGEILDFRETHPDYECDTQLVQEVLCQKFTDTHLSPLRGRDGFWGIIIIDDELLYAMTDYLGQKPMYYRTDLPAAASEPDALKVFGPTTLDEVYLAAVIKWGYCPDVSRTPYNEIKHVLPGHLVVMSYDGSVLYNVLVDPIGPADYRDRDLRDEIELAVERRVLSSDVPVACLLSGGLDSAIVYTLAKKHGNVRPYFVQERPDDGDQEYWKAMRLTINHAAAWTSPPPGVLPSPINDLRRCFWEDIPIEHALWVMQEPLDLGSLVPQVALSKIVQERVCLTGDGADEMFGGYARSMRYDSQSSDVFHELPAWHLPRLDRVMMRSRIEVRSPFLARRVVELALALPHRHVRQDKRLLRSLFSDILPPGITDAPKKPLRTPAVEQDREARSIQLVDMFRRMQ